MFANDETGAKQADFEQKCEAGIVVRCDDGNSRAVSNPLRVREIIWQPPARSLGNAGKIPDRGGGTGEEAQEEEREARKGEMFSQTGELTAAKDYGHNTQELNQIYM